MSQSRNGFLEPSAPLTRLFKISKASFAFCKKKLFHVTNEEHQDLMTLPLIGTGSLYLPSSILLKHCCFQSLALRSLEQYQVQIFFFFFINIFLFFYTFKWIHTIHTIHVTGHNCTKVYITISIARFERTPTVRSPKRRDQRVHVEF